MSDARSPLTRIHVMTGIIACGVCLITAGIMRTTLLAQQAQSNFVGGTPSRLPSDKLSTLRLKFPAGSRSNWHSHASGQLLMVEEGRGLTQDRGGSVREMLAGQPWFTKAGVEHWHGAAVDVDMVQLTIYEGGVKWLEPVSDLQYRVAPKR